MIGLNCDVLCVNMVDRSASGVIDKAMEADTPIVFFNREPVSEDMKRWEKTLLCWGGCERVGGP